ncbi:zinc finger CCCH domain-containing protein 2-like [Bidens hawaiensis]|uniref:zinc finger CCCH domain-containing protein 2-like n=1 Tax=Bidens hawaiensis TaxID=980011 RepID=UPI00404A8A24
MANSCLEQQQHHHNHKLHSPHQLYINKKSLRDIDIPPRKLLSRRASASSAASGDSFMDSYMYQNESPRVLPEETLFKKFLPYNDADDEEDDPYAADHFRMYEFKVRKCTRSRSHDWTDCPFAHPGEKARRRCPRRYNYLGTVCADFRRGNCSRGDLCEFAHGVFECWLHPSRYRTEACKDGKNCQRKICFFAHTQRQLRVVPTEYHTELTGKKHPYSNNNSKDASSQCAHCRCHLDVHHTISPTSTLNNIDLDGLLPPVSPPYSPAQSGAGFSPISRFADRLSRGDSLCMSHLGNNSSMHDQLIINQSIDELMRSMEAMAMEDNINMNMNMNMNMNSPWMDACFNGGGGVGGNDQHIPFDVMNGADWASSTRPNLYVDQGSSVNGPDLGWVNDLLT